MVRIAGIDLADNRLIHHALTVIYGVGSKNTFTILENADVSPLKRVHQLTEEEVSRIQKAIEKNHTVEGDLRREIVDNIKRLQAIGSYRGKRHSMNLPAHGQRTKTNARTKRGKRNTVGALKKEDQAKVETTK